MSPPDPLKVVVPDTPLHNFPTLQASARDAGYALLLHGSLMRDIDLIAVPWREDHDEERLVGAFYDYPAVIDHDTTDWRGWRTFVAVCPGAGGGSDPRAGARYFDVKVARLAAPEREET